jgi:hypothetical protein
MKTQSSFLIYFLQNNIKYLVLAKNQPSPREAAVRFRRNLQKQPSPEGGARPPPLGGYRHYCPCPLGGGGGARSAGGVGGLRSKVLHRNRVENNALVQPGLL